jgi:Phage integrase family
MRNRDGACAAPNTVNSSVRTREYLTTREIDALMVAAPQSSRYGHRDATMILLGYRHGLRAAELCDLQWSQVELTAGRLHVRRVKSGSPSVHLLRGDEIPKYAPCGGYSAIRRHPGVLVRARRADDSQVLSWLVCPDWRARWPILPCAPSHAPAWLRLCLGQCRSRHPRLAGLAWAQEHPAHRTLHGASSGSVQEFLEVTMASEPPT